MSRQRALVTQAQADGLAVHRMGGFDSVGVRAEFGLADGLTPVVVLGGRLHPPEREPNSPAPFNLTGPVESPHTDIRHAARLGCSVIRILVTTPPEVVEVCGCPADSVSRASSASDDGRHGA